MPESHDYTLTISLNVLEHLGIGLYSNVPAVLTEAVANSWDADAEKVEIDIFPDKGMITITDDGCGMTKDEINNKYLRVGYRRREVEGPTTPKKHRHVMGRKGIGKLSLFSIADVIEVHSVKKDDNGGSHKNGFVMDAREIKRRVTERETDASEEKDYHPTKVDENKIKIKKGTTVILRDLKQGAQRTERFLRKRLARRFGILGKEWNFAVFVNDEEITIEDRDYYNKLEYMWYLGDDSEKYPGYCKNLKNSEKVPDVVDERRGYKTTGWVATFDEQKSIEEGSNTIVVLAWGKLIHEDMLKDMKAGGVFSKYLIGEIRADFLDFDHEPDITTTGRQHVKEVERYEVLMKHVRDNILNRINTNWEVWRRENATKKACENPTIKKWFDRLTGDSKKYAKKLFQKIESFPVSSPDFKKELYKHGIMAFETLALKDSLSALDDVRTEGEFELLNKIVKDMDALEAVHYHQIVKNRMGVLKKFEKIAPTEKERVIQEHVFDHLWLLDSSWERASTDARMEQSVTKEFEKVTASLTDEEKRARIDIRYKTAAGKHIIIELKKYSASVKNSELIEQIQKYRMALEKCLEERYGEEESIIEIVCILGSPPTPKKDDKRNREALKAHGARYTTYDTLIKHTRDSYRDWLDKEKELEGIRSLIEAL